MILPSKATRAAPSKISLREYFISLDVHKRNIEDSASNCATVRGIQDSTLSPSVGNSPIPDYLVGYAVPSAVQL